MATKKMPAAKTCPCGCQNPDGKCECCTRALEAMLGRLIDAAETFASSDPEMPSHRATEDEFEAALAEAKAVLGKKS